MEAIKKNILTEWFAWHFFEMPKVLISVWKNYLWFVAEYFSIPFLLATLFSPWRMYRWSYPKSFNAGEYLSNLIFNTFSRFMGLLCRTALIIFGIVAEALVVVFGAVAILVWVLMPLVMVALVIFIIVKIVNKIRKKDPGKKDCPRCLTPIPIAATRCAACCADLNAA